VSERSRPPLSVVVPAREGLAEVEPVLVALLPQARDAGAEVVVIGGPPAPAPAGVRLLPAGDPNMYELRRRGIEAARGEVIAIGEDHAIPEPDWAEAVIRAHAERPDAAAIAGCLINATDRTVAGRANFCAFASPWQPPMPELPGHRPPPSSTLSFKRETVAGLAATGALETELIVELWATGAMVADDRVRVRHYQDHGALWSIVNGFRSARSSYGFARDGLGARERRVRARAIAPWTASRLWREACEGRAIRPAPRRDLPLIGAIAAAHGVGAALGLLTGPGRAPERVA
jgi:hypothetical protein